METMPSRMVIKKRRDMVRESCAEWRRLRPLNTREILLRRVTFSHGGKCIYTYIHICTTSFSSYKGKSTSVMEFSIEDRIVEKVHWALTHGIVMSLKTNDQSLLDKVPVTHAPMALDPTPYPAEAFFKAKRLAPLFNILIDKISRDVEWLQLVLGNTGKSDPFTGRLLSILNSMGSAAEVEEGSSIHGGYIRQKVALGINRSDYMLHDRPGDARTLLQVEINTIASSFGSLSTKIAEMYRAFDPANENIPHNDALDGLCDGLASAHFHFIRQKRESGKTGAQTQSQALILMVVQPGERNIADQRLLHFQLLKKYGASVPLIRLSLGEIFQKSRVDESTGDLLINEQLVSVVYFRAGYSPDDYPTELEWDARVLIEKSTSIKCPNIGYHLAGCKKVQQALAARVNIERFIKSPDDIAALEDVFAGLYNLDVNEGGGTDNVANIKAQVDEIVAKAIAQPHGFILKPQREGGGNNFCDNEMVSCLKNMNAEELAAFILMERIEPPDHDACQIRDGRGTQAICKSELGIYGVFLGDGSPLSYTNETPFVNKCCGHLLRVKSSTSNEGGVAAGFAVLGCPVLV